jgi:hypothetical protein
MTKERGRRLPAGAKSRTGSPTSAGGNRRTEARRTFRVRGHVDAVFGLFDAVSERDWVDDWNPQPVFPPELSREAGTVFTLERDGRNAIWTVLRYEPEDHAAEYLVAEPDYQHRWIRVDCTAVSEDETEVSVRYVTTALSEQGRRDLGRYGDAFLRAWKEPVQAAVDRLTP